MFELAIFTKGFILFRCLTRTSSDNCFCTTSILYVWHGFNRLNVFPKSSSWDIRHRLHPLATFAKSFILDVRHGFHPLNCFRKRLHPRCLVLDILRSQRDNKLTVSYVNYFYEKCMKITRNKRNLTTLMKSS